MSKLEYIIMASLLDKPIKPNLTQPWLFLHLHAVIVINSENFVY